MQLLIETCIGGYGHIQQLLDYYLGRTKVKWCRWANCEYPKHIQNNSTAYIALVVLIKIIVVFVHLYAEVDNSAPGWIYSHGNCLVIFLNAERPLREFKGGQAYSDCSVTTVQYTCSTNFAGSTSSKRTLYVALGHGYPHLKIITATARRDVIPFV